MSGDSSSRNGSGRTQSHQQRARERRGLGRRGGFTLLELLVVISIIALLTGILLPALGRAREAAKSSLSISNLRQLGIGIASYHQDQKFYYPKHSSSSGGPWQGFTARPRWADYMYPYMRDASVYISPLLSGSEKQWFKKPFAHTVGTPRVEYHGGYGYNFQYLGNSRFNPSFHGRMDFDVTAPSNTIVFGDTSGSRKGNLNNQPGHGGDGWGVYVLDPPRGSAEGAGNGQSYYEGGSDADADVTDPALYQWRSFPAERNRGAANFVFADGHAAAHKRAEIDDFDRDGVQDNGYWNGKARTWPDYGQ